MVTKEQDIAELVINAEKAPEPGGNILIEQDKSGELPELTAGQLTSAGWVYIYDTKTGERSLTNKNMLLSQLKKLRPDGTRFFTTLKPPFLKVKRGTVKCMLHLDNPERPRYDEMGLPTCRKANLPSRFQMLLHMQKKHKAEWAVLETERIEKDRQEERDLRFKMLKAANSQISKRRRRNDKKSS